MFDLIYRFDPANAESQRTPQTWREACDLLVRGNRDFAEMTDARRPERETRVIPFDPRALGWGSDSDGAPAQVPFAAVLGCADARVPTEMIFAKGCNELFVVRVAGNVLGRECLGSLRYAVGHFPKTLKLLVVLAHARCGAVTEAVDVYLQPGRYLQIATDHSIRSIADQILVAVRVAAIAIELLYGHEILSQPQSRAALLEAAVVLNAAWTAYSLRKEFHEEFPELGVVYGAYDLVTRQVRLPLSPATEATEEERGLFEPPEDVEGFRQLALRICSGKQVKSLLGITQ
ncbi:MAG TPA: carbonic anhydrase [Silvibacterium sp.]|nr:carbonic anhydrase [Silvibacterium sp.]